MQSELTRRKAGQYAIHFDSSPEEFMRFEKRALYMAGYVQGLEYGINVLEAAPQIKANLEAEIKSVAAEIKKIRKRK